MYDTYSTFKWSPPLNLKRSSWNFFWYISLNRSAVANDLNLPCLILQLLMLIFTLWLLCRTIQFSETTTGITNKIWRSKDLTEQKCRASIIKIKDKNNSTSYCGSLFSCWYLQMTLSQQVTNHPVRSIIKTGSLKSGLRCEQPHTCPNDIDKGSYSLIIF